MKFAVKKHNIGKQGGLMHTKVVIAPNSAYICGKHHYKKIKRDFI